MMKKIALFLLVASAALAGGNGTQTKRTTFPTMTCVTDTDCGRLLALPQTYSALCVPMSYNGQEVKACVVYSGTCAYIAGMVGQWVPNTHSCYYYPIAQEQVCYTDADCAGESVNYYHWNSQTTAQVTTDWYCAWVTDASYGLCRQRIVDAQCCAFGQDAAGHCYLADPSCY